jgi:hypothetical protein
LYNQLHFNDLNQRLKFNDKKINFLSVFNHFFVILKKRNKLFLSDAGGNMVLCVIPLKNWGVAGLKK